MQRVRVPDLQNLKRAGQKIRMVTVYDYTSARLVDASPIEVALVGDSLGNTMLGYETTLPVTMEEMLHHTRAARRGLSRPLLVGDMPFGSYQGSPEAAFNCAVRLLKEGGADAVKLEGGAPVTEAVRRMVAAGIPVMGHLGLTPQSVHAFGGFRVQGRGAAARKRLLEDAQALQEAGVFSIVLECIPKELGVELTAALDVPTIGIGAGPGCDGQVLVWQDLLGLNPKPPRFVKAYTDLGSTIGQALQAYADEVRSGAYPDDAHSYEEQ